MLGVFSSSIVTAPDELAAAGSRTPSPKTTASLLVDRFLKNSVDAVSLRLGTETILAYSHHNQDPLRPRVFASKDEIFCLFEGALDNLPSLRQQYGLAKNVNEALLLIEAYKALRDRAPYPASHVVGHLSGDFAFIVYDHATSTVFVATDQKGKIPLYWGITADGFLAFADDSDLLRGSCGKSIATFPEGCFFSTRWGDLKSYEHPKNKVTCIPATEEEIWGATFTVERAPVFAAMK
ncbi:stem-specific protein TSJT1-like [Nymphaea colorata]|nr:stem-specific protein TSJT1-like [Nymphaea colorata]